MFLSRAVGKFAATVCLTIGVSGCAGDPLENQRDKLYNVLLITIDTLRADHVGAYGYDKIETPNIDALADGGIRFERAYTPYPATLPAHVSIMTGAYPPYHGVRANGIFSTRDSLLTLAEVLKTKDYATGAVVGAVVLDSAFGLGQGFDVYDDRIENDGSGGLNLFHAERKAEDVTRLAQAFLAEREDGGPFFLWAHYFDPHTVYDPPPRFARQYPGSPYDGEVAYVDEQVGVLLETLRTLGLENDTFIILTADHGEGLGDHGEGIHGVLLYDSTVHVPLIVSNPELVPDARVIDTPVSLVDIMPTVLDLLNVDPKLWSAGVQGESLIPFMTGEVEQREKVIYFETLIPFFNYGWSGLRGVRRQEMKYIAGPTPGLFDTAEDPGESTNLYTDTHDAYRRLQFALNDLVADITWTGSAVEVEMDAERRAQLTALGYVSGAVHTSIQGNPFTGPDPEPRVWMVDAINNAGYAFMQGRHADALAELERLYAEEPANPTVLSLLGTLNNSLGKLDIAARYLEELVAGQPDREQHWGHLGVNYRHQGRVDKAAEAFRRALEINPEFTDAIYFLALIALERGQPAEAGFEQVVLLDPDHAGARNRLGEQYARRGNYTDAIPHLEHALSVDPNLGAAHRNLAACYIGLKDLDKAEFHLGEAQRLGVVLDPRFAAWLESRRGRR